MAQIKLSPSIIFTIEGLNLSNPLLCKDYSHFVKNRIFPRKPSRWLEYKTNREGKMQAIYSKVTNQYFRVYGQRILGSPIECESLGDALTLTPSDQLWLGIEIYYLAQREPVDGAIIVERDGAVLYEQAYLVEGEVWAVVSPQNASHVEVVYPEQGKLVRALLTKQEYSQLTIPACPHCTDEVTRVIRCGEVSLKGRGVVPRWQCQNCKRRFTG